MKSTKQIIKYICERIEQIYFRPRMYGGNSSGVDLILHYYHELFAEIHDQHEEYLSICKHYFEIEKCGSASFSKGYMLKVPDATDEDCTRYVVKQWKKISADLKNVCRH